MSIGFQIMDFNFVKTKFLNYETYYFDFDAFVYY